MKRQRGSGRAELYERLLTADPPLCGSGDAISVLNACERRRRLRECICRFDANQIVDDAVLVGCDEIAAAFDVPIDADDLENVAADLELCLGQASPIDEPQRDALDRLGRVQARLAIAIEAGAGLTDEFSDAVEP